MVKARAHMNSSLPTRINFVYKEYEIRRRSEVYKILLFARKMHGGWFLVGVTIYMYMYIHIYVIIYL